MLEWNFAPSVLLGLALWTAGYAVVVGSLRHRRGWGPAVPLPRQSAFYLGSLCALVALVSPLDTLGDSALFSAHMAQHMLLTFAAPALWMVGMPGWLIRRFVPVRLSRLLSHPLVAFTLFNGVMWAWHIPAAYDTALQFEPLHILEHLTFIAAALIGWWPVLGPDQAGGLRLPYKLAYLVPSMFSCTALAALITLSSIQLYPFYGHASALWGLGPLADQQLGGLVMWLPGDMIYVILIVWTFLRLIDQDTLEQQVVKP